MYSSAPPPPPTASVAPPTTSPSIVPSLPLSQPPPLPPLPPPPALPDSSCPHLGPVLENISEAYGQTVTWASHVAVRRLAQSASEPPPGKRRRVGSSSNNCVPLLTTRHPDPTSVLSEMWSGDTLAMGLFRMFTGSLLVWYLVACSCASA